MIETIDLGATSIDTSLTAIRPPNTLVVLTVERIDPFELIREPRRPTRSRRCPP
jgi:hypothetical protein